MQLAADPKTQPVCFLPSPAPLLLRCRPVVAFVYPDYSFYYLLEFTYSVFITCGMSAWMGQQTQPPLEISFLLNWELDLWDMWWEMPGEGRRGLGCVDSVARARESLCLPPVSCQFVSPETFRDVTPLVF